MGLDELAKTDRILVQQVDLLKYFSSIKMTVYLIFISNFLQLAEYAEAACSCACGYEGENEFEVRSELLGLDTAVVTTNIRQGSSNYLD